MPQPYEVLVRLNPADGKIAGAHIRYAETVGERVYELDPQPLSGVDDPQFADFAKLFSAQAVAERDAAKADAESALKAKDAENAAALKTAADAAAADKAKGEAALKAAADAKALVDGALATANEQIATLQGVVAAAEDRADKAEVKVAEAVAKAAATVAEMQAKLASDDRQWNVSLSPLRAHVAASLPGESPSLAFATFVDAALDQAGLANVDALVAAPIAKIAETGDAKALEMLGAPELIGQKPEIIADRLKRYGKDLFLALPTEQKDALVVQVTG